MGATSPSVVSAGKPGGELSANVLWLPRLTTAWNNATLKQGLESVGVAETRAWIKEEVGETPQARKRRLFGDGRQSPNEAATTSEGPKTA